MTERDATLLRCLLFVVVITKCRMGRLHRAMAKRKEGAVTSPHTPSKEPGAWLPGSAVPKPKAGVAHGAHGSAHSGTTGVVPRGFDPADLDNRHSVT